jgi:dTDP-glucose 4,6-dehydratase
MRLLVTGGAGFIGSHVLSYLASTYPDYIIVCADTLTYASNYELIADLEKLSNYTFEKVDITDKNSVEELFQKYGFTHVLHLAAESHVDNSIKDPLAFAKTNVLGTLNLLEAARTYFKDQSCLFYHISTDEVFGSLDKTGRFSENTAYEPRSPYSASKASSDHFVRAYGETYELPYVISNCSNNYGPGQHNEKLIPTVIASVLSGNPIPVYGTGNNVRDWLYVEDHVKAINTILHQGKTMETYCIGGDAELSNLELVHLLIEEIDLQLGNTEGYSTSLISFVEDRKGHDFRYAIDHSKLTKALDWNPTTSLQEGLKTTVSWYLNRMK